MARILIIVTSASSLHGRGREGLSTARTMHENGMAKPVAVLLVGEGVRCLTAGGGCREDVHVEMRSLLEAGVSISACSRSVEEHSLEHEVDARAIEKVDAADFLAAKAGANYAILTF